MNTSRTTTIDLVAFAPPHQNDYRSLGLPLGENICVRLPRGGVWIATQAGPIGGAAPICWTYAGPGEVILWWAMPGPGGALPHPDAPEVQTAHLSFYTAAT